MEGNSNDYFLRSELDLSESSRRVLLFPQELQSSSQALQEEKEEVKRRLEESTARVIQLEEDLIGVTQKGLQKETELDG